MDEAADEVTRRQMADAIAVIIYSRLPDLTVDFANRYALEYFGFGPVEIAHGLWMDLIHPDDRDQVDAAWRDAVEAGQHYKNENRFRMADGQYRRFRAEALPLRDERGGVVKWYGVLTPLEGPRTRGPVERSARLDYYPLRDPYGNLMLVELATWDHRPADPAAKQHPSGIWYRMECVEQLD
jgi:PAS domain S-box-containing protein